MLYELNHRWQYEGSTYDPGDIGAEYYNLADVDRDFVLFDILIALTAALAALGVLNGQLLTALERTKEIAMMRAVGWRRSRVMRLVMSEALLLALGGAVLGSLGAIALMRLLSYSPSAGRLVSGDVSGEVVLQGFIVALVLGLLGGLYPAYRASRLAPIEGLRHE